MNNLKNFWKKKHKFLIIKSFNNFTKCISDNYVIYIDKI